MSPRNAAPKVCRVCRTDVLIRLYFNGWACDTHAPSEGEIRDAAHARALANDARRARLGARTDAGRAFQRARETAVPNDPSQENR